MIVPQNIDNMNLESLQQFVEETSTIHIYGAGLNSEKPAHTAVKELSDRGWAAAPIHPRDGGATIDGFPIRPQVDEGVVPKIVVLFLAPERARNVVRKLIMTIDSDNFPLVWFQHGAEDEDAIAALEELEANYVKDDCIVRFSERHDLTCKNSILPQQWCLQVKSQDEDGCSIWSIHSSENTNFSEPAINLEWVGSMHDLEHSSHTIPRYIRSLKKEEETLPELASRLTN